MTHLTLLITVSAYQPNWKQPRLLLSFWYDPGVPKEDFPRRYAEIAAANFTAVMGGFGAKTADMVEAQLAVGSRRPRRDRRGRGRYLRLQRLERSVGLSTEGRARGALGLRAAVRADQLEGLGDGL